MTSYTFPNLDSKAGEPQHFTGSVRLGEICRSTDGRRVRVQKVDFAPNSRTYWHMHSAEQVLVVLQGTCLFKRFGMPALYLSAGQSVSVPANTRHWHGATDHPMVHLALNFGGDSWWMEEVDKSDLEYASLEAEHGQETRPLS